MRGQEVTDGQVMYETKGAYTLRLTVEWARETTLGQAGLSLTSEKPYQVIEIRSRLVARD